MAKSAGEVVRPLVAVRRAPLVVAVVIAAGISMIVCLGWANADEAVSALVATITVQPVMMSNAVSSVVMRNSVKNRCFVRGVLITTILHAYNIVVIHEGS